MGTEIKLDPDDFDRMLKEEISEPFSLEDTKDADDVREIKYDSTLTSPPKKPNQITKSRRLKKTEAERRRRARMIAAEQYLKALEEGTEPPSDLPSMSLEQAKELAQSIKQFRLRNAEAGRKKRVLLKAAEKTLLARETGEPVSISSCQQSQISQMTFDQTEEIFQWKRNIAKMKILAERCVRQRAINSENQRKRRALIKETAERILKAEETGEELNLSPDLRQNTIKLAKKLAEKMKERAYLKKLQDANTSDAELELEERRRQASINSYFRTQSLSEEKKQKRREKSRKYRNPEQDSVRRREYYNEVIKKDPKRLARWRKQIAEASKRLMERRKLYPEKYKQPRLMDRASQSLEERRVTLHRDKISLAKATLRKKLRKDGVPEEEIKEKAKELEQEMWNVPLPPLESIKEYKPVPSRARRKKQQDPSFDNCSTVAGMNRKSSSSKSVQVNEKSVPVQISASFLPEDNTPTEVDEFNEAFGDYEAVNHPWSPSPPELEPEEAVPDTSSTLQMIPIETFDLVRNIASIKCNHCDENLSSEFDLRQHVIQEHLESCWKCPKCKAPFLSPAEFADHFRLEHSNPATLKDQEGGEDTGVPNGNKTKFKFMCVKCTGNEQSGFPTQKELLGHVEVHHPSSFWPCESCDILKYSEQSLKFHQKYCRAKKSFK